MDLELATTEEIVCELMKRPTFVGIVIRVASDVTGQSPKRGDPMEVCASRKLSVFNQMRVLATAMRKILDAEAQRQNMP